MNHPSRSVIDYMTYLDRTRDRVSINYKGEIISYIEDYKLHIVVTTTGNHRFIEWANKKEMEIVYMGYSILNSKINKYVTGWSTEPFKRSINGITHCKDEKMKLIFKEKNDLDDTVARLNEYENVYVGVKNES